MAEISSFVYVRVMNLKHIKANTENIEPIVVPLQ